MDKRFTNNIGERQHHVSPRYPKRPLQAEGKWLLGRPKPKRLIILNIDYLLCIWNKRYLTVREQKGLQNDVIKNCDQPSSVILRNAYWYFLTDVSGQVIFRVFKGQEIQKNTCGV